MNLQYQWDMPGGGSRGNMPRYLSVEGVIVNIEAARMAGRSGQSCMMFVTVEDETGNITNFTVTPATYVADFVTLKEGMRAAFYYPADAPALLIYPPQYSASVVVPDLKNGQFVSVGYFNNSLVNETQTLQLNIDRSVRVLTANNQTFLGSPAGHDLVVFYETSTRSIPAQTTPQKIVVLCR